MIPITRLRPSSIRAQYHVRLVFAIAIVLVCSANYGSRQEHLQAAD